eukprot:CAMPEP_0119507394 /NCGR_PEP_ID=MMETSP1344-20130328/27298_1 /TAXON_ID=236787 /ORGANISM="Florenciella parvula, Strain CCMP2471" /LENGTH=334 /DNA_ID=CAMNT_0007544021 /DNA_START=172 /DNA_END=1176 /DNA_ORIENTATION=-
MAHSVSLSLGLGLGLSLAVLGSSQTSSQTPLPTERHSRLFAPATYDSEPIVGPYSVASLEFTNTAMDSSDQRIVVTYPVFENGTEIEGGSFPVIEYAHGLDNEVSDYTQLFKGLGSFGYIIVAHRACKNGCEDDTASLRLDPSGFAHYYKQQLLSIDWAKEQATAGNQALANADFSMGVGIAGHSMGGQSTVFSSSYTNATQHGVAAAVMHHAYTHEYPAPQVPFLAFTGVEDVVAFPWLTERFYNADDANSVKGIVNKKYGAGHFEPEDDWALVRKTYNPLIPQFTAAWFKLNIEGKTSEFGVDFEDMVYGTGDTGLCGGVVDGKMSECEISR